MLTEGARTQDVMLHSSVSIDARSETGVSYFHTLYSTCAPDTIGRLALDPAVLVCLDLEVV